MAELHLEERHAGILLQTLRQWLPESARVHVFGSRATGRGLKPHSDVDLLIDSPIELSALEMADLREALTQSAFPYHVDLLLRSESHPAFVDRLAAEDMIELKPREQPHAKHST